MSASPKSKKSTSAAKPVPAAGAASSPVGSALSHRRATDQPVVAFKQAILSNLTYSLARDTDSAKPRD